MARLRLEKITKNFGDEEIIHDLSCSVEDGEFIAVIGPSGCGKSTLLQLIAGLEPATSGRIYIDDDDVTETRAARRDIAMVFQSYALYPHMTVTENLSFGLRNLKYSKAEIDRRVKNAATMLHLDALLERSPSQLSGGQRQRVAIGRAIVREPKIFLFDEPLSNLDAELRVQMRRELAGLHQRLGNTMIYVTHDQAEAMSLADKIMVFNKGRIAQFGAPLELYNHPRDIFTASFIGAPRINLISGVVSSVTNDTVIVELPTGGVVELPRSRFDIAQKGDKLTLGLRPEHLEVKPQPGHISLPLIAGMVEALGDSTCIYAMLGDGHEITVKLPGQNGIGEEGGEFTAFVSPDNILLFDAAEQLISGRKGHVRPERNVTTSRSNMAQTAAASS
ncbi:MAG: ABC transporter ATP-binding protein [Aestuariivirga sp.]